MNKNNNTSSECTPEKIKKDPPISVCRIKLSKKDRRIGILLSLIIMVGLIITSVVLTAFLMPVFGPAFPYMLEIFLAFSTVYLILKKKKRKVNKYYQNLKI